MGSSHSLAVTGSWEHISSSSSPLTVTPVIRATDRTVDLHTVIETAVKQIPIFANNGVHDVKNNHQDETKTSLFTLSVTEHDDDITLQFHYQSRQYDLILYGRGCGTKYRYDSNARINNEHTKIIHPTLTQAGYHGIIEHQHTQVTFTHSKTEDGKEEEQMIDVLFFINFTRTSIRTSTCTDSESGNTDDHEPEVVIRCELHADTKKKQMIWSVAHASFPLTRPVLATATTTTK